MAKPERDPGKRRRASIRGEETIDASRLETFPYEYAGEDLVVEIETGEFTAVCPWSGLPDFGRLAIRYVPRRRVLELRSLKYYLGSYRNAGIYQEHAARRILRDLARAVRPERMEIALDYNVRGGIHTVCRAATRGRRQA